MVKKKTKEDSMAVWVIRIAGGVIMLMGLWLLKIVFTVPTGYYSPIEVAIFICASIFALALGYKIISEAKK